jgi:hypothetical protein
MDYNAMYFGGTYCFHLQIRRVMKAKIYQK